MNEDPIKIIYTLAKLKKLGKQLPEESSEDSIETFLSENASEAAKIGEEFDSLSDSALKEDADFMEYYSEVVNNLQSQKENNAILAKKGAKLKKLQALKKSPKAKKCACGCDLITFKEEGGKLSTKCSCNCKGGKVSKKEDGGILKYQNPIAGLAYQQSQYNKRKAAHADKYKTKKVSKPQKDKIITVEKAPAKFQTKYEKYAKTYTPEDVQKIMDTPYTKARVLPEVIVRPQTKTTAPTVSQKTTSKVVAPVAPAKSTKVTVPAKSAKSAKSATTATTAKAAVTTKVNTKAAPVRNAVTKWQEKLIAEGFDIGKTGADGKWGKKTEAAYQAYLQNQAKIKKVGTVENDPGVNIESIKSIPSPIVAPTQINSALANIMSGLNLSNLYKKGGLIKKNKKKFI